MKRQNSIKMINSSVQVLAMFKGFLPTSKVAAKIDLEFESDLVLVVKDVPNGTLQPTNEEFIINRFDKRVLTFSDKDYSPLGRCETIIEVSTSDKEALGLLGLAFWNEEREADGMLYCRRSNLFLTCRLKQIVLPTTQKQQSAVPIRNVIDLDDDEVIENLIKNQKM